MLNIVLAPSLFAHAFNGLFILLAFILFYTNLSTFKNLDAYKKVILLLLFSITMGIHGLSHMGLESIYNYNPFHFLGYI
jgi:hypothetical protein